MLYERWRQVARDYSDELALGELGSGRRWTFQQLANEAENWPEPKEPLSCPQGHSVEFIFSVLAAWRCGAVVCPLEPYQQPPGIPVPAKPCCHLKTTSATSGSARWVAFQPQQLAADAQNIVATMGLRPHWPNLGVISLAHSYGFSNLILPLLLHGIPLFVLEAPLPELVRAAAQKLPNITLAGVPALWRAWHEAGAIPANIRRAISAGAPLPTALEHAVFARTGLKIHNFYGSTECGAIAYDCTEAPRETETCVGRVMHNVRATLNEESCLTVISGAVGETYWPKPDPALYGGRFQTRDLAEINEGRIYLRGRLDDQINVAGRKVSPATIEAALKAHPAINDCLVFGIPDKDGERADEVVACVVLKEKCSAEQLRLFLLETLPGWQVPRHWWFVEALAVNQRGKLSRAEWRQRFLECDSPH